MHFEIIGKITSIETFASGRGIRELSRLNKFYGKGRWRKRKGIATVRCRMVQNGALNSIGMNLQA